MQAHRTLALALLCLSSFGCSNTPAKFTDADRATIRANIDSFTAAVSRHDFAAAASAYAEDGISMPPNAPIVQGRAAIQKSLESFGTPLKFTQPINEVEGEGGLAYARGTTDLTTIPPGAKAPISDKLKVLTVWRKQPDGSWKVIRASISSDLPAPR